MTKKVQKNEKKNVNDTRKEVPTILSLLDQDEIIMSDVQKEMLEDELAELSPIKENDINVSGIYAYDLNDKIEVKIYIRNGLSKNVNFEYVPFVIVNSKGEVIAYQMFNLKALGDIPAHSARPWKLYFDKKNVYGKLSIDDWKIDFDSRLKVEELVDFEYEKLPDAIEPEHKAVFDKYLKELQKLKLGEFSVSTFSIGVQKNGSLMVTVVMRNGAPKPIQIEKIPVTIKNTEGDVIRSNLFELDNFIISAGKAKICNFEFPTTLVLEEDVPLNDWEVSFKLEEVVKEPKIKKDNLEG